MLDLLTIHGTQVLLPFTDRAFGLGSVFIIDPLATPTPFNSMLWRGGAVGEGRCHEGFHSLLDAPGPIRCDSVDQGRPLAEALSTHEGLARIRRFSDGFWALQAQPDGRLTLGDLRMGQEPHPVFRFAIARRDAAGGGWRPLVPTESAGAVLTSAAARQTRQPPPASPVAAWRGCAARAASPCRG